MLSSGLLSALLVLELFGLLLEDLTLLVLLLLLLVLLLVLLLLLLDRAPSDDVLIPPPIALRISSKLPSFLDAQPASEAAITAHTSTAKILFFIVILTFLKIAGKNPLYFIIIRYWYFVNTIIVLD